VLALPNRFVNQVALPVWRRLHGDVYASPERLRAHVERTARNPDDPSPPKRFEHRLHLRVGDREGWPVYEAWRRDATASATILYLHGGGYVNEITRWHWRLVKELALEVPARCVVPIYPLAPKGTASDVVHGAAGLASELLAERGADQVLVVGDSAGAGLALAASLTLRDEGLRQPSRLVLISPWLDATLSDERQMAVAAKDKMLKRPGLREAARLYAGPLGLDDPLVSPINGDLRRLPSLTVFTGTHDILDCDSQRLVRMARGAGVPIDLHEVEGAPHVFPLFPSRQGAAARREIVAVCRSSRVAHAGRRNLRGGQLTPRAGSDITSTQPSHRWRRSQGRFE
jgi:monoterpene epsilon-lactone hydrolase